MNTPAGSTLRKLVLLTSLTLALAANGAPGANTAPETLVKTTVDDVLVVIRDNKDKRALRDLAEQKILPNFDFRQMTMLAVGRFWREATPTQQQALETGFRSLLVNTYTAALTRTSGKGIDTVEVKSALPQPGRDDIVVKTLIRESGKQPVAIDYRMASKPDGWKVYDVIVESISLVTTYRTTFDEEIRRSGIDGLIRILDERSRNNSTG